MTDHPGQSPETEPAPAAPTLRRPARWQLGIRTLSLMMALIAAWLAVFINYRQIGVLNTRITAARALARELVVDDPTRFAVVKLNELWMDDNRWDLYLPPGQYRICLGTRDVPDRGFPARFVSSPLPAGRHRLALELRLDQETWKFRVKSDDSEILAIDEGKEWASRSSSGGGEFSASEQLPADQPLLLYHRRYMIKDSSGQFQSTQGPTEGLVLWIKSVPAAKPSP
jgi:hypothetical protein